MSRWFRSYSDKHRNPKIARLSDSDFRLWDQLLCVASENDGAIPPAEDLKHLLKRRLDHLSSALKRLVDGGLIKPLNEGYTPHGWEERQYKSDTSTERVRKHRAKGNVTGNVSETPPDTETDTEVSEDKSSAPRDLKTIVFNEGLAFLKTKGLSEGRARPMLGKWVSQHGEPAVISAVSAAQSANVIDPIPYVEKILREHGSRNQAKPRIPI